MEPVVNDAAPLSIAQKRPAPVHLVIAFLPRRACRPPLGLVSIAAWYSVNAFPAQIFPGAAAPQPTATISFILCAAARFASLRGGPWPRGSADARRLGQVITNLISNAIKFTHEGGRIQVRVVAGQDDEIKIEVQDNTRALAHEGTGLGPVICKMIVEAHGGKISVESEEGHGATFTIILPIKNSVPAKSDDETFGAAAEGMRY